jgi:TATA-box binding protein (TBP) (component of TFIID and TFIIIB)
MPSVLQADAGGCIRRLLKIPVDADYALLSQKTGIPLTTTTAELQRSAAIANTKTLSEPVDFLGALKPGGRADEELITLGRAYEWAQNVVAKARLAGSVDLRPFSAKRLHAHVPSQFWAAVYRICDQLSTTMLVFGTGRVVIVGTRSLAQSYQAAHRLRLSLAADGCNTRFDEFWLENMVYTKRLNIAHGIDIAKIYSANLERSKWFPLMFPGLKYAMEEEGVQVKVFDTGCVVVMGEVRPERVSAVLMKVLAMAVQNPDHQLPTPDKRFEYRKEKKRLAFSQSLQLADEDME